MRTFRPKKGPFTEAPFFEKGQIEDICLEELAKVDLLPTKPEPIRIDRFIEKRFSVVHSYEDLGDGVLGLTKFGSRGVQDVIVARQLEDEGTLAAQRRIRSTLAHEAGHGLLHAHLFVLGQPRTQHLFGDYSDPTAPKVLCRDIPVEGESRPRYNGEWWEFQANRAIGGLLIPKPLMEKAIASFLINRGSLGAKYLDSARRTEAIKTLSKTFDVNPAVARIRLEESYPQEDERQLTL
jgi:hypothetical protein